MRIEAVTDKQSILKAWIAMEHFSEGEIDLAEGGNVKYKMLPNFCENWTSFFTGKLNEFKKYKKLSDKESTSVGFSIFFDIFRFDDLINDLSSKFKLTEEYRDESNSEKFTYCLSFITDNNTFKLVENSLFYTMSGYAHRHGDLAPDVEKIEEELKKQICELFEYDFDSGMAKLIESESNWSTRNFYEIQVDVTKADPLLHSFYISDLELAKKSESANLNRYLLGYSGERVNLDTDKTSNLFNAEDIFTILEPKNYPLGRFPSNPKWGLSLMQQIAVNVALNDENNIRGVNGPPGTGKTTLLKDIFAEFIVKQAYEICELKNRHLNETETYFKNGKIARIPDSIDNKNILVASSNNGAVQNIVNELPLQEKIDKQFLEAILNVDYFTEISNDEASNVNWGEFATEGGKSTNRKKMIEIVKKMSAELKSEEFISNENAYKDFSDQYNIVNGMRRQAQKVADLQKKLIKLQGELEIQKRIFQNEFSEKQDEYEEKSKQQNKKIDELDKLILIHENNLTIIEDEKVSNNHQLEMLKLNMEAIVQQKPFAFLFLKIINHPSANTYKEQLSKVSNSMMQLLEEQKSVEEHYRNEQKNLLELKYKHEEHSQVGEYIKDEFILWKQENEDNLSRLKNQISSIEIKIDETNIRTLDLTVSYSDLQQDNPWFDEQYRVEQSKLFIAAMSVRKQFLYENVKSLNGSYNIWNRISDYTIPEKKHLISMAWSWINFAIPVISTTFASFSGMFKHMSIDTISNLFIDEAGQATPQSAVGAVLRSKRIIAVGDPAQITPVVPLSNGIIGLIASRYSASEEIVNGYASVQTLVDETSKFGYQKTEDEWIGIPLWVHRRCLDPMFSISNQLSYEGKMVLPESMSSPGRGAWIDIRGNSDNKFVKEQAEWLKSEIIRRIDSIEEKENSNIFVISPFKNVVNQLKNNLGKIGLKKSNIGTVHTFQGKEASIVYLVLGASHEESGAARWAVSEPNLMNVAATRAKTEFYIIGDKNLYKSLKSEVIDKTLAVLDGK